MTTVEDIIKLFGGVSGTAKRFSRSHVSVLRWRERKQVPLLLAREVSEATGIPLHELRPDVFSAPPAPKSQPAA